MECEYQATRKCHLKQHQKAIHEWKKYKCRECEHQATTKRNLMQHQQAIHKGNKYQCRECAYQATQMGYLKKHQLAVHMVFKIFISYLQLTSNTKGTSQETPG